MNPAYSPEELAKEWKVSTMTIYKLLSKGVLPHFRVGRHYRIPADYLDAYMRKTGNLDQFAPVAGLPRVEIPRAAEDFVQLVKQSPAELLQNVVTITLFGSYARGTPHGDSDIDVLLIVRTLNRKVQEWVATLSDQAMSQGNYSELLSVMRMSESHWKTQRTLATPLYRAVTGEGVTLWPKSTSSAPIKSAPIGYPISKTIYPNKTNST